MVMGTGGRGFAHSTMGMLAGRQELGRLDANSEGRAVLPTLHSNLPRTLIRAGEQICFYIHLPGDLVLANVDALYAPGPGLTVSLALSCGIFTRLGSRC